MHIRKKIAIWGFGMHAKKRILPELKISSYFELIGIYTSKPEKRKFINRELKLKTWINEVEFLNDRSIDAVYLATPTGLHLQHGLKVLNAKKHLICEKSITCSLMDTLILIDNARSNELFLYEAIMYKMHRQYLAFLSHIKRIGKIKYTQNIFTLPTLENYGFRKDMALGGGVFWDVACYPISLIHDIPNFQFKDCKLEYAHKEDHNGVDIFRKFIIESNGQLHDCVVSYDLIYANYVFVSGEFGSVYAENIYSKDKNTNTKLILSDSSNIKNIIKTGTDNYYYNMFKYLALNLDNQNERHLNYLKIEQQSKLMNKCKNE